MICKGVLNTDINWHHLEATPPSSILHALDWAPSVFVAVNENVSSSLIKIKINLKNENEVKPVYVKLL